MKVEYYSDNGKYYYPLPERVFGPFPTLLRLKKFVWKHFGKDVIFSEKQPLEIVTNVFREEVIIFAQDEGYSWKHNNKLAGPFQNQPLAEANAKATFGPNIKFILEV